MNRRQIYFILSVFAIFFESTMLTQAAQFIHQSDPCGTVCQDLPANDNEPVCMMFSRYKRGYHFFVNLCHARRAICRDNLENISSKDYEKIILDNWQLNIKENDDHDNDTRLNLDNSNISRWRHFKLLNVLKSLTKSKVETQLEIFQSSMKYCFVSGQCLGLFPIMSITGRDVQRQYNILSWRYLLCFIILLGQIMITTLNFYRILTTRFSFSTCVEHVLSIMCPFLKLRKCCLDLPDFLKRLAVNKYPWIFTVVPYSLGTFIAVEILVMILTIIWTYSHVFIICISLFLASILERLNKKITSHENQLLPASYWRAIREDYNRGIRLVRFFDDSINGIVFVTFGYSLFFVCSRLYEVLGKSIVYENSYENKCLKQENWQGYEDLIYNLISTLFLIIQAFSVSLVAAKIHSASLVVAASLYNVPRSSFCTEIQRFLNQIHGTTVALTGLNFFYVTKELILSMIGTVVTYELVLLQFKRDD